VFSNRVDHTVGVLVKCTSSFDDVNCRNEFIIPRCVARSLHKSRSKVCQCSRSPNYFFHRRCMHGSLFCTLTTTEGAKSLIVSGRCRPMLFGGCCLACISVFFSAQGGLKIVAQRERWRDVEPEGGTRKFPAREVEMQRPGGLKIIRDEISGEMFKEKRSQVYDSSVYNRSKS